MENYYTPQEVSDKLKLNVRTLYKWIREGKLNAVKLGDVWRIPESALQEFIKESMENGKGEE
ncbi:DNA binding domain-containing protein, excisionase family [Desulfotomaculum arcticum]|uniref:DNA binding domain-containing protein, excisionase family n=1 Tax=Desulfotruncus arcticus DSM 17038 TaxID=1121424 RepID=A0A1I2ZR81_9FIRM|nr:helix-turn-helix domain-containing protein [Desulfotruncus arcticus]SFH40392.1 DNA binding domain-containing protein, excisionase family [Desulfotomaculum arcticum] [Desulfotruncus arcticus DSM 17038]